MPSLIHPGLVTRILARVLVAALFSCKLAAVLGFRLHAPTPLFEDNTGCIALTVHGHFAGSRGTNSPSPTEEERQFLRMTFRFLFIYYEQQIKREIKRINISGCRCNERLKAKTDGSNRLTYTGLHGDLEHLTIETRLIGERFECVMGECVI